MAIKKNLKLSDRVDVLTHIENGHGEQGMKHQSCFYNFLSVFSNGGMKCCMGT